jgi:hypothetical protein
MAPFVSHVAVECTVNCPFSVAHDYAVDFFRAAERGIEVRVPLRDAFRRIGGLAHRPVQLIFATHPDDEDTGRVHDALTVEWTAGTRLFPDFHGTLRLRIASVDTTALRLEGAYQPPLGYAGRIFDLIVGRRIARATMRDLLDRLGNAMERREAAYRARAHSGITA